MGLIEIPKRQRELPRTRTDPDSTNHLKGILMGDLGVESPKMLPAEAKKIWDDLGPYGDRKTLFQNEEVILAQGSGSHTIIYGEVVPFQDALPEGSKKIEGRDEKMDGKVLSVDPDHNHPVTQVTGIIQNDALGIVSSGDTANVPWMVVCQSFGVPGIADIKGLNGDDHQKVMIIDPGEGPAVVVLNPSKETVEKWGHDYEKPGSVIPLGEEKKMTEFNVKTADGEDVWISMLHSGFKFLQNTPIGLYRTEFSQFGKRNTVLPDDFEKDEGSHPYRDELETEYKLVLNAAGKEDVNFRLFDPTADKFPPYMKDYLGEQFPNRKTAEERLSHENYAKIAEEQIRALLASAKDTNKTIGIVIPTVESTKSIEIVRGIIDKIDESEKGRYKLFAEVETQDGLNDITDIADGVDGIFIGTNSFIDEKKSKGSRTATSMDAELDMPVLEPIRLAVQRMWKHSFERGIKDFDLRVIGRGVESRTGVVMVLGIFSHFGDGKNQAFTTEDGSDHKLTPRFIIATQRAPHMAKIIKGVDTESAKNVVETVLDGEISDKWTPTHIKDMVNQHVYRGNDGYYPKDLMT